MEAARNHGEKRRIDDAWFPGNMEFLPDAQGGPQVKRMRYESPKWDFPDLWGCHQNSYLPDLGNVQNNTTYSTADADTYNIHRRITSSFLGTFSAINTIDVGGEPIGIHPSSNFLYDVGSLIGFFYDSEKVKNDTFFSTNKTYPSDSNDKDLGVSPLVDNGNETVDVYNFNEKSISKQEDSQSSIHTGYSIRNITFEKYTVSKFDNNKNAGAYSVVDKGDELIDRCHISEQLVLNPENSQHSTYSFPDVSIRNETFEHTLKQYGCDKDDGAYSLIENGNELADEFHANEKSVTNPEDSQCSTYADISIINKTFEQSTLKQYGCDKDDGAYSLIENEDKLADEFHANAKSVTNPEDSQCSTYADISITNETFEKSTIKQYDISNKDAGAYSLIENGDKLAYEFHANEKSVTNPEDSQCSTFADISITNETFEQSTLKQYGISNKDGAYSLIENGDKLADEFHANEKSVTNPEDSQCSTYTDISITNETFEQSTLKQYGISNKDAGAYSLIENGDKLIDKHRVNEKSFTNPEDTLYKTFKLSTLNSEYFRLDSETENFDLTRQSDRYLVNDKSVSNPEDSLCSTSTDVSNRHQNFNQSTLDPDISFLDSAPNESDCGENSRSSKSVESYTGDGSTATPPKPVFAPKLPVSTDGNHPQLRYPADIPLRKLPKNANHNKECTICGKRYPTYQKLNDHVNVHKNYRPHKCECGKTFIKKYCLTRHRRIHMEYFTCSFCKAKFLLPRMLGSHKSDCPMGSNQHSQLQPTGQWLLEQHKHSQNGERYDHHSSKQKQSDKLQEPRESIGINNAIISPDMEINVRFLGIKSNPERKD